MSDSRGQQPVNPYADIQSVDTNSDDSNLLYNYDPENLNNSGIPPEIINKISTFRKRLNAKFAFNFIMLFPLIALVGVLSLAIGAGIITAQHSFTAVLTLGFPYACAFFIDFLYKKLLSLKAPADSTTKNTFYILSLIFSAVILAVSIPEWQIIVDFYQSLGPILTFSGIIGLALLCSMVAASLECYLSSKPKEATAVDNELTIGIMNKLLSLIKNHNTRDPIFPLSDNLIELLDKTDHPTAKLYAVYQLAILFKNNPEERTEAFRGRIKLIEDRYNSSTLQILPAFSVSSSVSNSNSTATNAPTLVVAASIPSDVNTPLLSTSKSLNQS